MVWRLLIVEYEVKSFRRELTSFEELNMKSTWPKGNTRVPKREYESDHCVRPLVRFTYARKGKAQAKGVVKSVGVS